MPAISKRKSSEVSLKQLIDDVALNDEQWNCLVAMLIETRESQTSYTSLLNEACESGCRKAIHSISREKMMTQLRLPVNAEASYAAQQSPSVWKIREYIRTWLENDTTEQDTGYAGLTLAALIKWMIYEVRLEWLARRAAERELEQPKTKLRRRGEEWRDRVYVDDAPENGPDAYIILTGFRDAKLPLELIENGVPLIGILRLEDFHVDGASSSSGCGCTRSDCQTSDSNDEAYDGPMNFWLHFDKSQCRELAIRSFCPPPPTPAEAGNNLDDLYDRISCVLYGLHELAQAHSAYLCAMKVIHVYESRWRSGPTAEQIASAAYDESHSRGGAPNGVDIVVEAMLRQVETTFPLVDEFFAGNTEQTQEQEEEEESSRQTSLSEVNSAAFARLTEKLGLLNLKYELISNQAELILPCNGGNDDDLLNVCRANDQACDLKDLPKINEARYQRDLAEIETCKVHLPGVFGCAELEGINGYKAKHLLNLLGFRRMYNSISIDGTSSVTSGSNSVRDNYVVVKLDDNVESDREYAKNAARRRYQSEVGNISNSGSEPIASSTTSILQNFRFQTKQVYKVGQFNNISGENLETPRSSENASSESSLNLDYNQVRSKRNFANSNENAEREKQRESGSTPSSESSCRCVAEQLPLGVAKSTKLAESRRFSSLEATSLLRSFEKCSSLFGLIDARESLGLASAAGGYPPLEFAELLASPWTPLIDCLNDYAHSSFRYFAPTDSVLLMFYDERPGRVAERRVTCALRTPLCLRDFCEYVVDEERDWLQRRTAANERSQVDVVDEQPEAAVFFKDEDFLLPGSLKAAELLKLKNEGLCNAPEGEADMKNATKASKRNSSGSVKNNGSNVDQPAAAAAEFEFIGYDLGTTGRVQVTNLASSYEASDGTRLHLTRDTWLYPYDDDAAEETRLEIEVPDCCSLRYHEVSDDADGLFHLTTKNGIIVAFARKPRFSNNVNPTTNELTYDIQISWPSGLIVKPVEYPDADYPFYVLQYYSSKDFGCESIANESHRKYLHNGDVVKFFNDGSIVVLRPNGIVITMGERSEEKEAAFDGTSISSWARTCSCVNNNFGLCRETSMLLRQSSSEWEEAEELHYVVLELDGRRYEVVDGRIVRELDRLRANVAEEYRAKEKFARRADGTDALFTSDAELIVSFPDGTRTLSSCIIEDTDDDDGFVLVSMYNRAEHPKYASVAGHRLSMHQLEFQLDELEFVCGNEVRVETSSETGNVSISRLCECNCATSRVSFDLAAGEKPPRLAWLRDKARRLLLTVWRGEDARFELTPETCQEHQHQHDDLTGASRRCRMFAVAGDGSTREYLHRSIWQRRFLEKMFADERACLIKSREDGVDSFLALVPSDEDEWTEEYRIRKAKPSVVVDDEEVEEAAKEGKLLAFKATSTGRQRRFLRARLVEGIADENSLISMQRALLRYWREIATGRGMAFEAAAAGEAITCECRGEIESWMRDVALGRVGTIDLQSYEAGRQELKKMRAEQDEKRTRKMIDRTYARARSSSSMPETNVLGSDNE